MIVVAVVQTYSQVAFVASTEKLLKSLFPCKISAASSSGIGTFNPEHWATLPETIDYRAGNQRTIVMAQRNEKKAVAGNAQQKPPGEGLGLATTLSSPNSRIAGLADYFLNLRVTNCFLYFIPCINNLKAIL